MSRRGRTRGPAREAKAAPVGIGNAPTYRPEALAGEARASMGDRVLACLATWVREDGTVVEPTTSDIAARLRIRAETYEREELNDTLTDLRQRRLLRYERDLGTGLIRWRLSHDGWGLARSIRTGTSGFTRGSADDRRADRFAKVRAAEDDE